VQGTRTLHATGEKAQIFAHRAIEEDRAPATAACLSGTPFQRSRPFRAFGAARSRGWVKVTIENPIDRIMLRQVAVANLAFHPLSDPTPHEQDDTLPHQNFYQSPDLLRAKSAP
jgi:hypothetical protein